VFDFGFGGFGLFRFLFRSFRWFRSGCSGGFVPVVSFRLFRVLVHAQKVIPLSGKVVFIWEKHYPGHRDLACQQARSRYTGKLFISYERNVTFHIIFVTRRDLARKLVEKFSR
jgi:hypothetical protein